MVPGDDCAEMHQRPPCEERLVVRDGLLWGVAEEPVCSLGKLGWQLVCRGELRADGADMRAGPYPVRVDHRVLGASRQNDDIRVHDRLSRAVARSGLQIELGLGASREPLAVLAGRAEDAHVSQRAYGPDRPQLGPRLFAAADDPGTRAILTSEHVDGDAAERSRSAGAELGADHAALQATVAVPDENGLIRVAGPEPVDTKPDRALGVAARSEDESVVADVRAPAWRCGEDTLVRIEHRSACSTDGIGSGEPSAYIRVEENVHRSDDAATPSVWVSGANAPDGYRRVVEERSDRVLGSLTALRVALVAFVLTWILGPAELRSAVPIWLPFLIALGLEVNFLVGAFRPDRLRSPDRRPQSVDRQRYGYVNDADELLLVRVGDEELWIPYAGETEDELDDLIAEAREREALVADEPARASWERPSIGVRLRRFAVGLGVIGLLAVAVWFVESRTGWDALAGHTRAAAARFSEEASRIAGKPVTIRCDESRDYVGAVQHADGVATVGGDRAYLTPERCHDLYRLAFEGEVTSSQTARALAVLAHEAWHLQGIDDEGTTECYALQSGVELGRRLGLSAGTARQMMRLELTENRLHGPTSFEYVVPPDCREGGSLDLNPADGRFP